MAPKTTIQELNAYIISIFKNDKEQ
jgi:hypothetical protein